MNNRAQTRPDLAEPIQRPAQTRLGLPLAAFLGAILGLLLLATTQLTLRDVDLYWHLIAGRELASGVPVDGVGRTWSFAPDQLPWTSTQWLAELCLFYLFEWGGWPALAAFRIVSAAAILGALAWTTLRGRPLLPASGPFILASLAVWLHSQERPQQATLLGATLLGGVLVRGLTAASLPRWWVLFPATWVWSNLHGGWVLVPAILGLVTFGRILDQGISDRAARRAALLGAGSLAIGALTPAGVGNITAAVRVSNAASGIIAEWEPTQPMTVIGSLSIGMLLLSVTGWTRSRQRIPRSEVVAVITLLLFGWSAWRNLTPALLLMAPLVAARLCTAFPRAGLRREPRWSAPVGVGIFIVCTVAALALLPTREHLPRDRYPVALASAIGELPGPQRVLNDYKVAGLVLLLGGADVSVGIDGRTDRFGAEYIEGYLDALELKGSWRSVITTSTPTSALLHQDSPLVHVLTTEFGWRIIGKEGEWVLLTPSAKVPQGIR